MPFLRPLGSLAAVSAAALVAVALTGCSGSAHPKAVAVTPTASASVPANENARVMAQLLQRASVLRKGKLTITPSNGKGNAGDPSYYGVVLNIFGPAPDQPVLWQFQTPQEAESAFAGQPAALAASPGDSAFACGPVVVLGSNNTSVDAAHRVLAAHYSDCSAVVAAH